MQLDAGLEIQDPLALLLQGLDHEVDLNPPLVPFQGLDPDDLGRNLGSSLVKVLS